MKALKRFVILHQHDGPIRALLVLTQRCYRALSRMSSKGSVAAVDGGWPTRIIPLPARRLFGRPEEKELRRIIRQHSISVFEGATVKEFEERFAEFIGCKHAIAVSSGTSALHCALIAAGVGPNDEVIVPAFTYISTASVVLYQQAVPRFVDISSRDGNIDVEKIEQCINERTKVIVPVHICGVPCDMDSLREIARKHNLLLIEDAAQAHGSEYREKRVGSLGDIGCFSLQSTKTVTTGEGGMLVTDDDELARRARLAMNLGETSEKGEPTLLISNFSSDIHLAYRSLGWNYRMSALQAAFGLGQMKKIEQICAVRRRNAEHLKQGLQRELPQLEFQQHPQYVSPCLLSLLMSFSGETDGAMRDTAVRALLRENIHPQLPYQQPLPAYDVFGADDSAYPIARRYCKNAFGLRVDLSIGREEIGDMLFALKKICRSNRPKR